MRLSAAWLAILRLCALANAEDKETVKPQGSKLSSWLKDENKFRYDVECNWLRSDERAVRIAEGRCPPLPPSTTPPPSSTRRSWLPPWLQQRLMRRKKKALFSVRTKQALMSAFSLGGMKIINIDLDDKHTSHELLSGISLSLSCNEALRKKWRNDTDSVVSWYVNNQLVQSRGLHWRVTVSTDGILNIWPLMEEDGGSYECAVDGGIMGTAMIHVEPKSVAVIRGIYNYLYVAMFYIPVGIYAFILISRDFGKPPRKSKREDRMAAFLEEHVLKNGQDAKENIAKAIYGNQFEERKEEVTKSITAGVAPGGGRLRGNRETVMTLLCGPKSQGSEVKQRRPKALRKGDAREAALSHHSVMPKVDPSRLQNQFQHEFRHFVR